MKKYIAPFVAILGLAGFAAAAEVSAVPLTPETFALNLQKHVDTLAQAMPAINYKFTLFPVDWWESTQWHSHKKSYYAVRDSVVQKASQRSFSDDEKLAGTRSEQLSAYLVLRALDEKSTREALARLATKLPDGRRADFKNTLDRLERAAAIFESIPHSADGESLRKDDTKKLGHLLIIGADRPTLEAEAAALDGFFSEDAPSSVVE